MDQNNIKQIAVLLILFIVSWFISAPSYSNKAEVSPEIETGRKVFENIRPHLNFSENPLIKESIERLGKRILKNLPTDKFEFQFFPIQSNEMNAFALPNGYIIITDRLIENITSEEELAFVLAHETAHILRHHFMNFVKRKSSLDLATVATMIVGIMASKDGDLQEGIPAIALGLNQNFSLKYSREQEFEADHYGMRYLLQAGYDGQGGIEFMKKLQRLERLFISIPAYLSTHPLTHERITNLEGLIEGKKSAEKGTTINIERLKIWCMLESESADTMQGDLLSKYQADKSNVNLIYALARTYEKRGNASKAEKFYKEGLEISPHDIDILRDYGIFLFRWGRLKEAQPQFQSALELAHDDFLSLHYLGRCFMDLNRDDEAIERLEKSVQNNPEFADNYNFLGILYKKKNLEQKSHQNFKKYFSLIGNKFSAQFHDNKINGKNVGK
ncbi:MAG: M48 family metalloprotease [bacterium]